jgi:hypothetical protein
MWRTTTDGQQLPQRAVHHGPVERGMAHPGTDCERAAIDRQPVEAFDSVDVDQMGRPRHPERHDRHQTLAAGQNATVQRRKLRQCVNSLLDRSRDMSTKWRGFHRGTMVWRR